MERIKLRIENPTFPSSEDYKRFMEALGKTEAEANEAYNRLRGKIAREFSPADWEDPDECADEVLNRYIKKYSAARLGEKEIERFCRGIIRNLKSNVSRRQLYAEKSWTAFELGKNTSNPERVSKAFTLYKDIKEKGSPAPPGKDDAPAADNSLQDKVPGVLERIYFIEVSGLKIMLDASNPAPFTLNLDLRLPVADYRDRNSFNKENIVWSYPDCKFYLAIGRKPESKIKEKEIEVKQAAEKFGESLVFSIGNHPDNGAGTICGAAVIRFQKAHPLIYGDEDISRADEKIKGSSVTFFDTFAGAQKSQLDEVIMKENPEKFYEEDEAASAKEYFNKLGLTENEINYLIDKTYNNLSNDDLKSKYGLNSSRVSEKIISLCLYNQHLSERKSLTENPADLEKENIRLEKEIIRLTKTTFGSKYIEGAHPKRIIERIKKLFKKR
jgi:hypothetical protein